MAPAKAKSWTIPMNPNPSATPGISSGSMVASAAPNAPPPEIPSV
jgi:hypothetical protein